MTEVQRPCPGCGVERYGNVCCGACWARLPAKLPIATGKPPMAWRRRLPQARITRDWGKVETILDTVRAWLTEHPAQQTTSR